MSISVIIPNFNGEMLLKKNIPAVITAVKEYATHTTDIAEIIIVDDNSSDASVSIIRDVVAANKDISIIEKQKNEGFASAVNTGVSHAKGEIVILLNTDVSPKKDFLLPLVTHFSKPEVFAVGCVDESVEGGKVVLRGRGIGHWERGFLVHEKGELEASNTLWVSGGSGAFRRDMWNKLQGMDTIYNPFYWEDIDLSYRALKAGYKIFIEQKSRVTHIHSEGVIKKTFSKQHINEIAYRNQILFVWKNITDYSLLVDHVLWLPLHLGSAILRRDTAFLKGFLMALFNFPHIIHQRLLMRKFFLISDKGIFSSFAEIG
jgi:GT2 family glycosyltransferase